MKTIILSVFLLLGISTFAQTAQTKAETQTTTTTLSPKAKALCTTWYLTETENFGDVHKPNDNQKGDLLLLLEAGQYRFIYNGEVETGSWAIDKGGIYLTLTKENGESKKLKVLESTATTLKIDYRDSDEIHNILYYSTAKPATSVK